MNILNYTRTVEFDIYSKSQCPLCDQAKSLLKSKDLVFTEHNVDGDEARAEFNTKYPGVRQMPYIVINGQPVGGLAGLQAALKQLEL